MKKSKTNKAKISIIVPIYNVEEYVEKCLMSLVNQTFKDIEIWAISDGSPDNSVDIVKKIANNDNRVKCIEKENGGYGSVLEFAISNISTDYFLICDPDDWLKEDAIEKLYSKAIENKVDLVVGAKYLVYNDEKFEEVYDESKIKTVNFDIEENLIYTKNNGLGKALFLTPSPHAKLYKTKYAKKICFPKKVSYTDFLLYILYLNECNSFIYTSEPLAYYLVDRPGNTMTDVNPRIIDYHYIVFESIVSQLKTKQIEEFTSSRLIDQFRYIVSEIEKIKDINIKQEKCKKMQNMLEELKKYKKQIRKESWIFDKKKAIFNNLLLNRYTSNCMYRRLVK